MYNVLMLENSVQLSKQLGKLVSWKARFYRRVEQVKIQPRDMRLPRESRRSSYTRKLFPRVRDFPRLSKKSQPFFYLGSQSRAPRLELAEEQSRPAGENSDQTFQTANISSWSSKHKHVWYNVEKGMAKMQPSRSIVLHLLTASRGFMVRNNVE